MPIAVVVVVRRRFRSQQTRPHRIETVAVSLLDKILRELISLGGLPGQAQAYVGISVEIVSRAAVIRGVVEVIWESRGLVGVVEKVGSRLIGRTDPTPRIGEEPELISFDRTADASSNFVEAADRSRAGNTESLKCRRQVPRLQGFVAEICLK